MTVLENDSEILSDQTDQFDQDESIPSLSFDSLARLVSRSMRSRGEWAGCPVPIPGHRLHVENRYPYKKLEEICWEDGSRGSTFTEIDTELDDTETLENVWYSRVRQKLVMVLHNGPLHARRAKVVTISQRVHNRRFQFALETLGVSLAWGMEAEAKATERLSELITPHAFRHYVLTGSFLETSKRSGVTYLFRRLRPTIAIRPAGDGSQHTRIIAALCLHPIAYYENTFGGSMVPTDDVIAHLMLMRGDEPLYWRRANQHPADAAEAGI